MSGIRVRFAPSPTGELHVGGARTALFNFLFARAKKGVFVLRIDDTDLERSREDYIEKLLQAMSWLGLKEDEGPYYQSSRLDIYRTACEKLIEKGRAYRCYCSVEKLEAGRAAAKQEGKAYLYPGSCRCLEADKEEELIKRGLKPVTRLLTPDSGTTAVKDLIRGEVVFQNESLDDFIIIKSNGLPTYNFASIVDDLDLKISHVIRAEEHLSNTPRQQLCAEALGEKLPLFAHVPMILAPDRSKLSKRHGATAVEEFKNEGYLPEALINYIALLGWSPGGEEEELLSMQELTSKFRLEKVTKTAAVYDVNKLAWVNGHYIRSLPLDRLAAEALPFYVRAGFVRKPLDSGQESYLQAVLSAVRERARTLEELASISAYFYRDDFVYEEKGAAKHFKKSGVSDILRRAAKELEYLQAFEPGDLEACFDRIAGELEIGKGRLNAPARLALTGRMDGPGLFELMALLGRKKAIARLNRAAAHIDELYPDPDKPGSQAQ